MSPRNVAFICVLTLGLAAGPAVSHAPEPAVWRALDDEQSRLPQPFHAAERVPANVTLYLHVEEAATIRRELANRPIAVWFNETLAAGEAGLVWAQVAKAADIDEAALFDALLGKRMTFVVRGQKAEVGDEGVDDEVRSAEWVLVTHVAAEVAEKALAALGPVALGPRSRMAMLELPEHELLLARRGDLLVIGPKENRGLFRQMLRSLGGREVNDGRMLAVKLPERAVEGARELKAVPSIALVMQHGPPLGGCSVALAQFGDDEIELNGRPAPNLIVRHYGSYDAPPFARGVTQVAVDSSILDRFEGTAMLAMIEPNDAGRGGFELFLHAMVGEGLLSPKMRANLGERRVIVLGEIQMAEISDQKPSPGSTGPGSEAAGEGLTSDGRPLTSELSSVPSVAVCYELKESNGAEQQLDRQMLAFSRRLDRLDDSNVNPPPQTIDDKGAADAWKSPDAPKAQKFASGRRTLDVPAAAQVIEGVSLNWTVVDESSDRDGGGWYVIASHPDHLDEVVSMLKRPAFTEADQGGDGGSEEDDRKGDGCGGGSAPKCGRTMMTAALHSAGVADGPRLAHLLLKLRHAAPLLASDADHRAEMRESLRLLSDLAAGLEHVRWRLTRPSANEIDVEVRIRLAEPQ